jgi:hypothetical protein
MTAAELGRLVDALLGDITVREAVTKYEDLSDTDLALLVRWLAGDRHITTPASARPMPPKVDDEPMTVDLGDVTLLG